jgi:hypothetical protein
MQRPEQTVYYLEQMGRLQPQNAGIWFNIAEIQYTRLNQKQKAAQNYTKTIQLGAANPQFSQLMNQAQQRLTEINSKK